MEINLAENLKLDSDIPFINVQTFQFLWAPNCHATLRLMGHVNRKSGYRFNQLYDSKIRIWLEKGDRTQMLYQGYLIRVDRKVEGYTEKVTLEASSASIKFDRQLNNRSFQNVKKTYADVVEQVTTGGGGQVISEVETDRKLNKPVIQYEETDWIFMRRLSSHLGTCIIPDIETGKPNLWFGIRKGERIPFLSEDQYDMKIGYGISFEVESREYYKIGDWARYMGQEVTIFEVSAIFEYGELTFSYLLRDNMNYNIIYQNQFAGLGLKGIIQEVKEEYVKIALDIDQGISTGDYFYRWYPETGNAFYAMPESGARAILNFCSQDERDGFILQCLPTRRKEVLTCQERHCNIEDGNSIELYENNLKFSKERNHNLSLGDGSISFRTVKALRMSAEGRIKLKAKQIRINTPDELNIYQG